MNEKTDEVCEKCGKPMVVKLGRFGKFLSCTGYPDCKNAKPIAGNPPASSDGEVSGDGAVARADEKLIKLQEENKDTVCEKCGKPMRVRKSRYGYFLGCTGYPKCKTIVALAGGEAATGAPARTGVKCPKCGEGELVEKRTRKGHRIFWGCDKYPKCDYASWDRPGDKKNGDASSGEES